MSAKYTRLGQLEGKFGVPAREYLTASGFDGNFTYESRSTCPSIVVQCDLLSLKHQDNY